MEILTTVDSCLTISKQALDLLVAARTGFGRKQPKQLTAAIEAVQDLEKQLLLLKQENLTLQKTLTECQEALLKLQQHREDTKRKTLHRVAEGAFVYVLDDDAGTLQQGPWYCQPCLDQGEKGVFKRAKRDFGTDHYQCMRCGNSIQIPNDLRAEILTAGRSRREDLEGF